jgi:peptide/nickel transport system substrate-binding protein
VGQDGYCRGQAPAGRGRLGPGRRRHPGQGTVRLSFQAEYLYGWPDWNASLEIVARSARQLGMDIAAYFPEANIWHQNRDNYVFGILMDSLGGTGAVSPCTRAYAAIGSMDLPPAGTPNRVQNFGRWVNQEANQIINRLASETDAAKLKQLWTRLNIICLQEMPAAGLMYRPGGFHTVNTSVWTGFPRLNDGANIPPTIRASGYGVKALYHYAEHPGFFFAERAGIIPQIRFIFSVPLYR